MASYVTFADILRQLSIGELSNLSWADNGAGTITQSYVPKICMYVNEALLKLHTTFPLKENDLLLELHDHITNYHLIPDFAVNTASSTEEIRYILDLPLEPFVGDVIRVNAVYTQNGIKLPLNDADKCDSVFTPQSNILQIRGATAGTVLSVCYQAKHAHILDTELGHPVELPAVLYEALKAYVAYKVYSHINTQEALLISQNHLSVFNTVCESVKEADAINSSVSGSGNVFVIRGWI